MTIFTIFTIYVSNATVILVVENFEKEKTKTKQNNKINKSNGWWSQEIVKEFNFLITQIEEKRKKKRKKRNENLSTQQPKFTQGASTAQIYFILIGVVVVVVEGRHGWDRCFVAIKYRWAKWRTQLMQGIAARHLFF